WLGCLFDQRLFEDSPIPRHEFIPAQGWLTTRDFRDDIGDVDLRLDAVEFCRKRCSVPTLRG
ncbi:hypothetical protein, partial [Novosphingobium subterraneum]